MWMGSEELTSMEKPLVPSKVKSAHALYLCSLSLLPLYIWVCPSENEVQIQYEMDTISK